MEDDYKGWLEQQKKLWLERRKARKNMSKEGLMSLQTGAAGGLQTFIRNIDEMIRNSSWQIIQLCPADKPGEFKAFIC
jgi:hypothetical protein